MFDTLELREATAKAALDDVSVFSDDELLGCAQVLIEAQRCLDAATGHVLAELDARGATDAEFGQTTATWFAHQSGVSRVTATARVRVGTTLRRSLHATDERLSRGQISWEQARAMIDACNPRIEAGIAEVQEHLLDSAVGVRFERWAR